MKRTLAIVAAFLVTVPAAIVLAPEVRVPSRTFRHAQDVRGVPPVGGPALRRVAQPRDGRCGGGRPVRDRPFQPGGHPGEARLGNAVQPFLRVGARDGPRRGLARPWTERLALRDAGDGHGLLRSRVLRAGAASPRCGPAAAGAALRGFPGHRDFEGRRSHEDPRGAYKYNSFPVNAAQQLHELTGELGGALDDHEEAGRLSGMPPVIAFQSLVDATITANEIIKGLLARLPTSGNEIVVFDINRNEALQSLIEPARVAEFERLRASPAVLFRLTLITNRDPDSQEIAAYTREAGTREVTNVDLPLRWPRGVLSLGHVALPFLEDDPVYGLTPQRGGALDYPLGALTVRGEGGTHMVPLGNLARLRSNPFSSVIRDRIVTAIEADSTLEKSKVAL